MKIFASDNFSEVYAIAGEVVNLLAHEGICGVELYSFDQGEYINYPNIAVVSVYIDGDWKHDHLRADWLVKENFDVLFYDSYELEDTGSDWGPEVHTYYINMEE